MKKPEMILFDYGHTLCYEGGFDCQKGMEVLIANAAENPLGVTPEELRKKNDEMYAYLDKNIFPHNIEMHHHIYFRTLFDSFGLKFNKPFEELEEIYWDAAAPPSPMPGAEEIIDFLNKHNIRTGIISNMSFSGAALTKRINKLLPENNFEFILASSEYGWRKPEKFMFEAAIAKAALPAESIWFCGDNTQADIVGAHSVGMLPVWVCSPVKCYYRDPAHDVLPNFDYVKIENLTQLEDLIEL